MNKPSGEYQANSNNTDRKDRAGDERLKKPKFIQRLERRKMFRKRRNYPNITPTDKCKLRQLKLQKGLIKYKKRYRSNSRETRDCREIIEWYRRAPMQVAIIEEVIDET
jgi:hypothetical protein